MVIVGLGLIGMGIERMYDQKCMITTTG
jgi:hypothetical protein